MTKLAFLSVLVFLLLSASVLAGSASFPDSVQGVHPPTNLEIPFLERQALGARWIAMGGASLAAVDDGSAIAINPAGLGKIRRIEFLGTLEKQSRDIDATWFGTNTSRSLSSTVIREATLSFPFPTYRGSLVIAGSVFRPNILDSYTVRTGKNPANELVYRDGENRTGTLTGWAGGFAVQVSPEVYVGGEFHAYTGKYKEDDTWGRWGRCTGAGFAWDLDLGGYGASVGMQYQALPILGIGAVLKSPQKISLKGDYEEPDTTVSCTPVQQNNLFTVDETATLPYSMGLGLSFAPGSFLISLDAVYTDWREITYPTNFTRDPYTDEFLYSATTDVRVGVEYALSAVPVRLRAGYARVPLEFDNWFEVKKDRTSISLGVGAVVQSALTFDVAWQRTSFERAAPAVSYSEKQTNDRLALTLAYRF
jgi:long-subunit fatty acid transport protein